MRSGLLLVDKPAGMTSHDLVSKVRKIVGQKQVGHAGTLDPAATGLLVMLLGEATKLSNYILNGDKAYEVVVHLGMTTDSGDKDGAILEEKPFTATAEEITTAVNALKGEFHWPIPMYSAKKQNGKKLYELARQNIEMEAPKKKMIFSQVKLSDIDGSLVRVYLKCSKGSFVRTWAEQLGEALGCGGTVHTLRRVESVPYSVEKAIGLESLIDAQVALGGEHWISMDQTLPDWISLKVDGGEEKLISNGQIPHKLARFLEVEYLSRGHESVKVLSKRNHRLLALLQHGSKGFKIQRVFNNLH